PEGVAHPRLVEGVGDRNLPQLHVPRALDDLRRRAAEAAADTSIPTLADEHLLAYSRTGERVLLVVVRPEGQAISPVERRRGRAEEQQRALCPVPHLTAMPHVHETGDRPLPVPEGRLRAPGPLRGRVSDGPELTILEREAVGPEEHRPLRRAEAHPGAVVDEAVASHVAATPAAHEVGATELTHRVLLTGDTIGCEHRALRIGEPAADNGAEPRPLELGDPAR